MIIFVGFGGNLHCMILQIDSQHMLINMKCGAIKFVYNIHFDHYKVIIIIRPDTKLLLIYLQ